MLKKYLIQAFYFTRKEKNGSIVILGLVLLVTLAFRFFYSFNSDNTNNKVAEYKNVMDSLEVIKSSTRKNYNYQIESNKKNYSSADYHHLAQSEGVLFSFDPNTLPVSGWIKLGVKEKIANNIQKYISKGGKFRQADDLKKIWGLRPDFVGKLIPFVRIVNDELPTSGKAYPIYEKKEYVKKEVQPLSINEADTTAFISLPGIGPAYARRIINFRNRLGGFYSINQVGETFGLPDSTFQKIKPYLQINHEPLKKININTATLEELKAHPYIRWQLANLILQYKAQHGPYQKIEDIKKIMAIDEEIYNKVAPYLAVE